MEDGSTWHYFNSRLLITDVIKMLYEKTTHSMNDRELLIRIDERVEGIDKLVQVQDLEIDDLKMWKNRMAGGLSIILGISGYSFLF